MTPPVMVYHSFIHYLIHFIASLLIGKIDFKEFSQFCKEIQLMETEDGHHERALLLTFNMQALLELSKRIRRADMAGLSRFR